MKVLIIDNYDSFTYILKQYFGVLGADPEVFYNDQITIEQIKKINPTHIVLSPGPGTVEEAQDVGIMFEVLKEFHNKVPILGVCLGHQAIGKFFGDEIVRAPIIMHGKRSKIWHEEQGVFQNIKSPFEVMRYHSLAIESSKLEARSSTLSITARTEDNVIMGIQHNKYPIFGVQFHPESLGTKHGKRLLKNFLKY